MRIRSRTKRALHNRRGATLVEIVVSVLIISMAALVLATAYGAAMKVMRRGVAKDRANDNAFEGLEFEVIHAGDTGPDTARFSVGGVVYVVQGSYVRASATEDDVTSEFVAFRPLED